MTMLQIVLKIEYPKSCLKEGNENRHYPRTQEKIEVSLAQKVQITNKIGNNSM